MVSSYSQFTLEILRTQLGIEVKRSVVIPDLPPVEVPESLQQQLKDNQEGIVLRSEKAVSEALIAPVLIHVQLLNRRKVTLFSGEELTDGKLNGYCDFMFIGNPEAFLPQPPIIVLVEGKKQDILSGLPQCVAEMVVAQRLNQQAGFPFKTIYGCITIGTEWLFVKLENSYAIAHTKNYLITELPQILAAFTWMIDQFQTNE